ncbi:MAG: reverse transcriptase family protein [Acidobacteriota bacterium]|nr:reverse transcriptase family protein [Acidobacteriota bacterium]
MKPGSVVRCASCFARNRIPSVQRSFVCGNCGAPLHPASLWQRVKHMLGFEAAVHVAAPPSAPPRSVAPPSFAPPVSRTAPQRPSFTPAPPAPVFSPRVREEPDAYQAGEILGLSPAELRKRALKINPFRTAWIGRVDTIPPQSDERTAIIDRGLMLRGLLTEEQLKEIHRVGDLWLEHHEAAQLARSHATEVARADAEQRKKEKAEQKAQKKKEAAEREERRRAEVARRRAEDIIFVGAGVSSGMADRRANVELLQKLALPLLATPADLARVLGITISELRWLSFHSEAMERMHYVNFEIAKRSGGTRVLSAPHAKLSAAQHWILREILEKLPTEPEAHGFVRERSTVTNARPHVGRDRVVNLDLSDFFPTITFRRVRGLFRSIGYSPAVATLLALLCTEAPRRPVVYDGSTYWVAIGTRALPQGACTSPAISNQIARHLDRRLAGMAAKYRWTYTRYADDLTFSCDATNDDSVGRLMASVRHIVEEEGFAVNPRKGRVQRRGGRQTVTGIVVNEKLSIAREEVRRLRAILHGASKSGLAAQNRENIPNYEQWLRGKIAYVHMVDPVKGDRLLRELEALRA